MDKIKTGLEYASSYIETAKDIADLVSQSLGHRNKKHNFNYTDNRTDQVFGKEKRHFGPQGLVAAFFKLLGLDPPKINAIAVNSAIFLAQMVRTKSFIDARHLLGKNLLFLSKLSPFRLRFR